VEKAGNIMATFTQFSGDVDVIAALSDKPNSSDSLTAAQLKAKFDDASGLIKTFINSTLLSELASTTDGSSASDYVGLTTISGVTGTTVQSALEDLVSTLQAVANGSSGADFLGMTAITEAGAGETVQSVVEGIVTWLKAVGAAGDLGATAFTGISATTIQTQIEAVYAAIVTSSGDVTGPASATDADLVQFNGATGKLVKDGIAVVTTVASPGLDTDIPTAKAVRAAISAGGAGDVSGPASSTDENIALFDSTSGKLIKDGGISLSGSDATAITGTAGTSGNLGEFNADGDLIDSTHSIDQDLNQADNVIFASVSTARSFYSGSNLNAQTGTSYTLVLTDSGKFVTLTNASAIALTIPLNAAVAYPIGTQIEISSYGAGDVTVSCAGTLNSAGSFTKLTTQYKCATLKKMGTDTWLAIGLES